MEPPKGLLSAPELASVPMVLPPKAPSTAYQIFDLLIKTIATAILIGILVILVLIYNNLTQSTDVSQPVGPLGNLRYLGDLNDITSYLRDLSAFFNSELTLGVALDGAGTESFKPIYVQSA